MEYAIALVCGLLFGALVAWAKHFFIWRPYAQERADGIYWRMAASSAVNVLALLLVFLVRNIWPYSFSTTIIATAVGLTAIARVLAQSIQKRKVLENK